MYADRQTVSELPSPDPVGQREHLPLGTSLGVANTHLAMLSVVSVHIPSVTCSHVQSQLYNIANITGPFHGAIAVPSVTRCRCRRGHRCARGV